MDRRTLALPLALLGATNTLNAERPFWHRGRGSIASFAAGVVVSELPLQTIAVQAATTAALLRGGGLRRRDGRAAAAVTAASCAGLLDLHRHARRADDALEDALVDALGPGYRDRIVEPPHARSARRRLPGTFPSARARRRYVAAADVPYGPHGRRNTLDVWRRRDVPTDGRAPVLVQIHGGAWTMGSKEQQALPLLAHLTRRGWVSAAVNYRLAPRATWPELIVDVKRAIAWVKANIADHGGDPGFVVVTGGSAGGHLAALAALTPGDPEYQPGFEEADTAVQAAVPFYGVYDWLNRDGTGNLDMEELLARRVFKSDLADDPGPWDRASPMSRVGPHAPPFLLLHGTTDTLVPVAQARSFARVLREASREPVAYAELPKAQHAFELFDSARSAAAVDAVDRFLGVVYGDHVRATEDSPPSPS